MMSRSNAAEDHRTVSELISWALTGPPDLSRGPGSEPERFAAALRKTVCQVDSMRRELEGVDSRRRPWWTLKGEAKNADIFERSIRREKAGEPWQDAMRVAIERADLSPTRGEGMVRDALRANLVRDVAVTAGLKVSRGRESPRIGQRAMWSRWPKRSGRGATRRIRRRGTSPRPCSIS